MTASSSSTTPATVGPTPRQHRRRLAGADARRAGQRRADQRHQARHDHRLPLDKVDHHYRDPKVWKTGDKWYMTFGVSSAEKRGQMWLFSSDDMVRWTYERVLFEHPDPNVFMLECPDFFPIKNAEGNEKWVIGFSAMGAKLPAL